MTSSAARPNGRDAQRRQTRQRVYTAAVAEFKRVGMAAADVSVIVREAGVARGTFYFHFPTKEHILAELERQEEARLAAQLARFMARQQDRCPYPCPEPLSAPASGQPFLAAVLAEVVRLMSLIERRAGKVLFREMLALHFSPHRPEVLPGAEQWADYPMMALVVRAFELARDRREAYQEADALRAAQFFMLGLYAVLITSHEHSRAARAEILDNFVATVLRSVEAR